MFISELDVINECLASQGETPLNSLDDEHPFVSSARRMLRVANGREQAKGWWFNRERLTLTPDPSTGYVYVPADTISIDPVSQWTHLVQRGRRLYDPKGAGYAIGKSITVTVLRLIPFEDLPLQAQAYISLCAQRDYQRGFDADRMKVEQILMDLKDAYADLRAEDIRNAGVNLLYKPSTLQRMHALGGRLPNYSTQVVGYSENTTPALSEPVDGTDVDFVALFEGAADGS